MKYTQLQALIKIKINNEMYRHNHSHNYFLFILHFDEGTPT